MFYIWFLNVVVVVVVFSFLSLCPPSLPLICSYPKMDSRWISYVGPQEYLIMNRLDPGLVSLAMLATVPARP